MTKTRLSSSEHEKICDAFKKVFAPDDQLWLFGSKVNLSAKGGDIDLYVETEFDVSKVVQLELQFSKELFYRLDDRKIDVVIRYKDAPETLIFQIAKKTGVRMV
ncbi:nucleotidyltransferase domain-containing protein [Candidatus Finniella inopinata]|uniref:Nucleotidyltransferase domain-containing protein n=1 Tax=Candidatus Finniella inopinata TaxID=1696036 RepID=A0A4Q7DJI4_9PROT|nr:nucleotidyltransferase domain-containing protein [Candidatus Finniella inopinata]RZI46409.1 nucleotidyltransferase domain-containing protein [Candidatus Finniella inopinata]